jgi:ubiquitin carboxyl-terminal hydrolase 7
MIHLHISVSYYLIECVIIADNFKEKKLDEEAAYREARRKEREEQHLYLGVRVITDESYRAHGGTDLTAFDLNPETEPSAARFYRLLRKSTIKQLIDMVGEDTGTDPRRIRLWCMVNRQNKTIRPDTPIVESDFTIEETQQRLVGSKSADLRLWAEVADNVNSEGDAIWPATPGLQNGSPKTDLIVLFLKYFDVDQQTLNGAGHIYISKEKKVEDLVPVIIRKMGWPEKPKLQLKLFEVINLVLNPVTPTD